MACCYIAAFCIGQLVKACQFFDFDDSIRYNDDEAGNESSIEAEKATPTRAGSEGRQSAASVLSLSGMTCAACANTVENALLDLDEIQHARVSLALQQATIVSNGPRINTERVLQTVRDLGHGAELGPRSPKEIIRLLESKQEAKRLWESFSQLSRYAVVIQSTELLISHFRTRSSLTGLVLWGLQLASLVSGVFCQYSHVPWIHTDGWRWVKGGRANMNTLVSLSICLGLLFSVVELFVQGPRAATTYLTTSTGLTLTVVAGRYLECLSRRQVSKDLINIYKPLTSIDYVKLSPTGQSVPSTYLRPSDEIFVEPFSTVPCDCYIVSGNTLVNQSMLTGESLPAQKGVGDVVLGGTRNLNGRLVCIVRKEKGHSFYTQLLEGVADSSATKSDGHELLNTIIEYFVIVVIFLAIIIPLSGICRLSPASITYQNLQSAAARSMTILTSACPCALGLAIPSAVATAVYSAQKRGVLITGGASTIQKLDQINCIIFDKTGTLTQDSLEISELRPSPEWDNRKEELWTLICAVEGHGDSGHPIGKSIFAAGIQILGDRWLQFQAHGLKQNMCSSIGQGVSGDVRIGEGCWHHVIVGSARYLQKSGVSGLLDIPMRQEERGIKVHIAVDGTWAGTIRLEDTIRVETKDTIDALKTMGYMCKILTGDMSQEAHRVASQLDIPLLASQASPSEKLDLIKASQKSNGSVAMVGDGLNDAPSLAAADVGFGLYHNNAFATTGASVMILNGRIDLVVFALRVAKLTREQIVFNLKWAAAYNVVAFGMATGWVKPFGFVLTPSIAAALMSASSIFMTIQSFQLRAKLNALST